MSARCDRRPTRSSANGSRRPARSWIVRPFVREWVSFQYHNLVEHPYPSIVHGIAALDLILCRNVMIYFDWDVIERILGRFHECLVDGGWLAVGHAESNTEVFRAYRTVNVPGATLYQKNGDHPVAAADHSAPAPAQAPWLPPPSSAPASWSPPRVARRSRCVAACARTATGSARADRSGAGSTARRRRALDGSRAGVPSGCSMTIG